MIMLHRIEVNIVNVLHKIVLVTQCVLPIAPLPDAPFAFVGAAFRKPLAAWQSARERRFYQTPAQREIGASFGKKSGTGADDASDPGDERAVMVAGVAEYAAEVRAGSFPGPEHEYSIDEDELERFTAGLG